jgi:hypothetical protein
MLLFCEAEQGLLKFVFEFFYGFFGAYVGSDGYFLLLVDA